MPAYSQIASLFHTLPNSMATVSEGCAPTDNQYLIRSDEFRQNISFLTNIQSHFLYPIVQRDRIIRSHLQVNKTNCTCIPLL